METSYATREELQNVLQIVLDMHKELEEIKEKMKYIENMAIEYNEEKSIENAILSILAIRDTATLEEIYNAFPNVRQAYIRIAMTNLVRAKKVKRIARGKYEYLR